MTPVTRESGRVNPPQLLDRTSQPFCGLVLDNARGTIAITTLKNRTLSPLAQLFIKTTRAVVNPLVKAR
jgi:hypothetical protein